MRAVNHTRHDRYDPGRRQVVEHGCGATIFGRDIPQTLLLHANELNTDTLEEMLQGYEKRGYRFITLDAAMKDPAYATGDTLVSSHGPTWLWRWRTHKGLKTSFAGARSRLRGSRISTRVANPAQGVCYVNCEMHVRRHESQVRSESHDGRRRDLARPKTLNLLDAGSILTELTNSRQPTSIGRRSNAASFRSIVSSPSVNQP
jgi:hypothetical protein